MGFRGTAQDEFFAVMQKVVAKGDLTIDAAAAAAPACQAAAVAEAPASASAEASAAAESKAPPKHEDPPPIPAAQLLGAAGADVASRVAALFGAIDLNGNGSLSLSELEVFLGPSASEARRPSTKKRENAEPPRSIANVETADRKDEKAAKTRVVAPVGSAGRRGAR